MYDKTFDELSINDLFTTATGDWIVFDKGSKTLIAYKANTQTKPEDADHVIFYDYDFP